MLALSQSSLPVAPLLTQLPDSVYSFFKNVSMDGYPEKEAVLFKEQPWRNIWDGPKPSPDGTLMIALPRRVDFGVYIHRHSRSRELAMLTILSVGSNNLGGY